jgi:predicted nuclease of restriction endonuclease-like (RecB) superfamily
VFLENQRKELKKKLSASSVTRAQRAVNKKTEIKGFFQRNLQLMIQFQKEYPDLFAIPQRPVAELPEASLPKEIRPQPVAEIDPTNSIHPPQAPGETQIMQRIVAQLPWAHNVILIQKLKDLPTRLWYARQAITQGWSRDTLALMIRSHNRVEEFKLAAEV